MTTAAALSPPTATTAAYLRLHPAPPLHRAVEVADRVRGAAVALLDGNHGTSQLAGRDHTGQPLAGAHRHTHWLPLPDRDRLGGILAWTPAGLATDEVAALRLLARRGVGHLDVELVDVGARVPALLAVPATVWSSITPYARQSRRTKQRPPEAELAADLRRECRYRGLPTPVEVTVLGRSGWQARRPSRPQAWSGGSWWLRVRFPEPVAGPLALGRLAHFGMGLFAREQDG